MSPDRFAQLLGIVGPSLTKLSLTREALPPGLRLAVTIRYLATGDSLRSLSYAYRVGYTTISAIIPETCAVLWEKLSPIVFLSINENAWRNVAKEYFQRWHFPHCLGAIDGKHIAIQCPSNTGSDYFNYKGFFSVVLLAICDANYRFIMVDVGASGRQSDGGILACSQFGQKLNQGLLKLPAAEVVEESSKVLPYVFVGDEAFPLKTNLMRPYPGNKLSPDKTIFNYRLSLARQTIENTFGVLSSRFRIFRSPIALKVESINKVVCAATCLHNWLKDIDGRSKERTYCPPQYTDYTDAHGSIHPGAWRTEGEVAGMSRLQRVGSNRYGNSDAEVRDLYNHYFFNEGNVPFQWKKVSLRNE